MERAAGFVQYALARYADGVYGVGMKTTTPQQSVMRDERDESGDRNVHNHDYEFLVVGLNSGGDLRVEGFETEEQAREWLDGNEYKCGLITARCSQLEPATMHWEDHT